MESEGFATGLVRGAVILAVGLFIVSAVVGVPQAESGTFSGTYSVEDGSASVKSGSYLQGGAELSDVTVKDTTGYALQLNGGADSFSGPAPELQSNQTTCTWLSINGSASVNRTAFFIDESSYIGLQNGQWTGWTYDDGTRKSALVQQNATATGGLTHVCLTQSGDDVTLSVNGSDTTETATLGGPAPNFSTSNWDGTFEETRVWADTALNSSERATLRNDPVKPLDTPADLRIMYDAGEGDTLQFYGYGTGTITGGTWVDGFAATTLDAGTDFATRGGDIILSETYDGAAAIVASGSYESGGMLGEFGGDLGLAFQIAPLALLVTVAGAALTVIRRL
ncbi:LamG domain-containing protein [Halomarina rubra]|uniref:LamG domain-containing protein n=1 Tax=Halomarina rubra TaxID=2071873 RepID=A0ABD6B1G5_9EURY|nr:LamG domain-containing protein [Halomarina rubra]